MSLVRIPPTSVGTLEDLRRVISGGEVALVPKSRTLAHALDATILLLQWIAEADRPAGDTNRGTATDSELKEHRRAVAQFQSWRLRQFEDSDE